MQMDEQPNRISVSDVFGAAVNGLCVCLDHKVLWVSKVMDVSIQVCPHLVQVYRPKVLNPIDHVHHQVWHNIKIRGWEAHLELAKGLCDELFHSWQFRFIDAFCVIQLKK